MSPRPLQKPVISILCFKWTFLSLSTLTPTLILDQNCRRKPTIDISHEPTTNYSGMIMANTMMNFMFICHADGESSSVKYRISTLNH